VTDTAPPPDDSVVPGGPALAAGADGTTPSRRWWRRRRPPQDDSAAPVDPAVRTRAVEPVDLPPNDPLLVFLTQARGPVLVDDLELDTPAVTRLREAGVQLLVPLVTSGELVGVVQLGERLSEQPWSTTDRQLLEQLAGQAAPALRVGQLLREQAAEIRVRERYEQELKVAQVIQQRFLPGELPEPTGWRVSPYYRAARQVGGDFYDVLDLPGGKLGLVIGDVTDKGVPAALVMASARSILRAAAQRIVDPETVLERVNDELVRDIPARMFVTCLYGVLDPATGRLEFANAGHDLPFVEHEGEVTEAHATGMPLGMMPGSTYDNVTLDLAPGSRLLLYSDGIAEAHAPDGEMFGFGRTGELLVDLPRGAEGVDELLGRVAAFTGPDWEQEDDITLLLVERSVDEHSSGLAAPRTTSFRLPSTSGGEREAITRLLEAIADVDLPDARRDALGTAVGEAVMNAMEHAHGNDPSREVAVDVTTATDRLTVAITDEGGGDAFVDRAEEPDIEAKLRGEQAARGWGLFLVRSLVDDVRETSDGHRHTLTLTMRLGDDA
jgi:serine phosphatase RsbU (regulator of sigma subunit)/anti-sigma regulatory factor (Ser/Thr protein kinase)